MQHGHVTGTKDEKAGSGTWYNDIQAEHLARIEADQAQMAAHGRILMEGYTEDPGAPMQSEQAQPVAIPAHTEAPCSINVKFDVEGMQAQATGRGATPEEAVSNLQNTMAKTIVALGTPPAPAPMNRFEKLGRLVTCGLQKAQDDSKLTERFLKAVQLVTLNRISRQPDDPDTYVADSLSSPEVAYYVMPGRGMCQCPDRRRHEEDRTYKCKHILAVLLAAKLDGLA